MRFLLFASLLLLNLGLSAWNLQQFLRGGDVQHAVWIVVCLGTTMLCGLVTYQEYRIRN